MSDVGATAGTQPLSWEALRIRLAQYGQDHLLRHVSELSSKEQSELYGEVMELDVADSTSCYKQAQVTLAESAEKKDDRVQPLDRRICGSVADDSVGTWQRKGLEKIGNGEIGVLLLAGGQGTRLGVPYPKGMYDVGLPSGKTLYQIQAERIIRLQELAKQQTGKSCVIPWYIMTSEHTKEPTEKFFKDHKYFGLLPTNVILFEQYTLPCFDFSGKIILDQKYRLSRAPDGNGGLYKALYRHKVLGDMKQRGITGLHVYCVDNILVKMADPVFIGFCEEKGADCGVKVVRKELPDEKVGVVCVVDGKHQVVEYSEISSAIAEQRNDDGSLTYNAGNICNHYFTVEFVDRVCQHHRDQLVHHVANKKIPFVNDQGERITPKEPNGIKMEKFVFDVIQFSKQFAVLEVLRDDEFSPLKSAPAPGVKNTPITARAALLDLHRRFVLAAGGTFNSDIPGVNSLKPNSTDEDIVCEISPLLSYSGENLESLCKGHKFTLPVLLDQSAVSNGDVPRNQ